MEKERVNKHLEKFRQSLSDSIEKLDPKEPVKVVMTGFEGPALAFYQGETMKFFLGVYMGVSTDYRSIYKEEAEEFLRECNLTVA